MFRSLEVTIFHKFQEPPLIYFNNERQNRVWQPLLSCILMKL